MDSAASSPFVSVIMPAYNAAAFIGESIDSVIQQTYTNWELIIADDGSADDTKKVVQSYVAKDSRIRYYYQQNGRQGKARNLGLSKAKGELVAFLDADDVWINDKLSVQTAEMTAYQADLVFSDSFFFERLPIGHNEKMLSYKGMLQGIDGLEKMLEINRIPILTVLVKRAALEAAGNFTEKPAIQNAEDYHLWLKLIINGCRLYGTPHTLAAYRLHNAASTSDNKLSVKESIEAFHDLAGQFPAYRRLILTYLKQKIKDYHYTTSEWQKDVYSSLIRKSFNYLHHSGFAAPAVFMYRIFGLRATRKALSLSLLK